MYLRGFPGSPDGKELACNAGDLGSVPELGRSPGERNGNPLQYSHLGNPMDRGACWVIVHRAARSYTRLSDYTGEGDGTPLQYSCLENPVDSGAW